MTFEMKFTSVLQGGETILRRMNNDPRHIAQTVDVMRSMIETMLQRPDSEIAKAEMASAAVLFKELYPNNTDAKLAITNSLCRQIIEVSESLDEQSAADENYYRSLIGEKGSDLFALMKGVVESIHSLWATQLKEKIRTEKQLKKGKRNKLLLSIFCFVLYILFSILFYYGACHVACREFSVQKSLPFCIPFFGQISCVVFYFIEGGFWVGIRSVLYFLVIMGILGYAMESAEKSAL